MRNKNAKVSNPNGFVTNSGDRYHVLYQAKVNGDGTISLVENGKDDIQMMIDSYRESTDINFIVQRILAGDTSVLNKAEPMYGDFTNLPKTFAEALQLVIDAEADFMKLPADVRNAFDNDYKQWFATSGNDEWYEKMAPVILKDEVFTNETEKANVSEVPNSEGV